MSSVQKEILTLLAAGWDMEQICQRMMMDVDDAIDHVAEAFGLDADDVAPDVFHPEACGPRRRSRQLTLH